MGMGMRARPAAALAGIPLVVAACGGRVLLDAGGRPIRLGEHRPIPA
jgi:hypothetical protein